MHDGVYAELYAGLHYAATQHCNKCVLTAAV